MQGLLERHEEKNQVQKDHEGSEHLKEQLARLTAFDYMRRLGIS